MNGHIDLTADTDDSDSSDSDFGNQHVPLQPVATASSAYHAAFKSTASSQRTKAAQKARSAGRSQALRPKLAMPMVRTSSREGSADEHGVELASLLDRSQLSIVLSLDEFWLPVSTLSLSETVHAFVEVTLTTSRELEVDGLTSIDEEVDKEGQSIAFGRRRGAYTSTDTSNVHLVPTERITFSLGIVEPQPGEPAGKILGLDFNVTVTLQQCIGVPSNSPGSTLRFERELLVNGALNDGTVELRPSDCKGGIVTTVKLEGLSEARRSPFGKSDTTVPSREKLGQVLQNSLQQAEEACARATADRLAHYSERHALLPRQSNTGQVDARSLFTPLPPIGSPEGVLPAPPPALSLQFPPVIPPVPLYDLLNPQAIATTATGPPLHALPKGAADLAPTELRQLVDTAIKSTFDLPGASEAELEAEHDYALKLGVSSDVFSADDPRRLLRDGIGLASVLKTLNLDDEIEQHSGHVGDRVLERRLAAEEDAIIGPAIRLVNGVFDQRTGVTAFEANRRYEDVSSKTLIKDPNTIDTCDFCGALACRVHSPYFSAFNVPTSTSYAALRSSSSLTTVETVKNVPPLAESRGYQPCSHAGPCKTGKDCSCFAKRSWCDRFCGCDGSCSRRFRGCNCIKGCRSGCPCRAASRECDPHICACTTCFNQDIRLGLTKRIIVRDSTNVNAGLGLFMLEPVRKDQLIEVYGGDLFDQTDAEDADSYSVLRNSFAQVRGKSYLFNVDKDHVADAENSSNMTRFINSLSAAQHNCCPKIVYVDGSLQIAFYASRNIQGGEELSFDYGDDYTEAWRSVER